MSQEKRAASRSDRLRARIPHRSPEQDAFVDQFLSTICDTSRRYILELLAEPNGDDPSLPSERRSGEIAEKLGLSSATTSEHLHQLAALHLITMRKEGRAVYYQLSKHSLVKAFQDLLRTLDRYSRQQPT